MSTTGRSWGEELWTPSLPSSQSSSCSHYGMCYGVPKQTWKCQGSAFLFGFWKGVLVDSLTSYTFCTGKWKEIQIPPETFMPELNLQHMRANASWQLRFSSSLQNLCGELRWSVLQELSCTEFLWVWQLHFLLCAAACKENLLCFLMFILILHVFTTHRRKWQIEKIFVFTKAKRLLQQTARQTQCKCQSLSFSIVCHVHDQFYLPKGQ